MAPSERPWNDDGDALEADGAEAGRDPTPPWGRIAVGGVLCAGAFAVVGGFLVLFVLGTGTTCACSPTGAQIDWKYDAANRTVLGTHEGGDVFDDENTGRLVVTAGQEGVHRIALPFGAGDAFEVAGIDPGTTVRVVWYSDGGNASTVVASFEVPAG